MWPPRSTSSVSLARSSHRTRRYRPFGSQERRRSMRSLKKVACV
jgi:hypothetical protein